MKLFRPDKDQFSMFRLKNIHRCQICDAQCDTSRIVARPDCCKCLVHLGCFNELAAHSNSASTFRCPQCARELSSESVRAARRQTSLATTNENGEEEDNEMMLGSMATKNITATKTTHRRQTCGGNGSLHDRKETSRSSGESSDSIDPTEDASPPPESSPEEVSESSPRLRSYTQSLTFFTPY
jgi:hypothetical protein